MSGQDKKFNRSLEKFPGKSQGTKTELGSDGDLKKITENYSNSSDSEELMVAKFCCAKTGLFQEIKTNFISLEDSVDEIISSCPKLTVQMGKGAYIQLDSPDEFGVTNNSLPGGFCSDEDRQQRTSMRDEKKAQSEFQRVSAGTKQKILRPPRYAYELDTDNFRRTRHKYHCFARPSVHQEIYQEETAECEHV